ncbi:MAG: hypothetical protein ACTSYX_04930 [Candidatus Thorarchaeota archaeon]
MIVEVSMTYMPSIDTEKKWRVSIEICEGYGYDPYYDIEMDTADAAEATRLYKTLCECADAILKAFSQIDQLREATEE